MIKNIVMDAFESIAGSKAAPYINDIREVEKELEKIEIMPRNYEDSKYISDSYVNAIIQRYVEWAEICVSDEKIAYGIADLNAFKKLVKRYLVDLLSNDESRVNGALDALKKDMMELIKLYNNVEREEIENGYAHDIRNVKYHVYDMDCISFTKIAICYIAAHYIKKVGIRWNEKNNPKKSKAEKIDDAFNYEIGNEEWNQELARFIEKSNQKLQAGGK